jgi:hypothetical protein
VHFDGPAFQFAPRDEWRTRRHFLPYIVLFILVVLIGLAIAILVPV